MKFINPPKKPPQGVLHKTFFSKAYDHKIGYNLYLPPDYDEGCERYPVTYHLHGWTGDESSEIRTMEQVYNSRRAITVFPNNSPLIKKRENLPVERMVIDELIPLIDSEYRTDTAPGNRAISGFSMGGGMAFYFAVKYHELFSRVTAYAGTYHHYYHAGYSGVGEPAENAAALYDEMIKKEQTLEEGSLLWMLRQNANKLRGTLRMDIRIGSDDVLICDNEIMHLYLNSLEIPHEYMVVKGMGHELHKIL